jgi:hypothetical protein
MVTVGPPTGRTEEKNTVQPYASDGNYTTPHANKTLNTLQQPEGEQARTVVYYETVTIVLDHLALSPKNPSSDSKG